MKQQLAFDFIVNKEEKTIHISREFAADLALVWRAWTTPEMLDKWWGPQPWRAETKSMDFREGGSWLYAMVGPEGERHWSKSTFVAITEERSFSFRSGFSDEEGNLNPDMPQNLWENKFIPRADRVQVDMLLVYDSLEDLEKEIAMGFKEGMTVDFQQLDALLATHTK